jgi:hypothetical protein
MEEFWKGLPGKVESSSEIRTAVHTIYEMFVAMVDEGFTEKQACLIIGQMLKQS